ncbi:hypothetical protein GWK36_01575 [Caldichromatium japonicum]|uniref:Tetratricopeptide repeat protein n=1 Tax=Caldichromatium japonicum TaxID=2699430 RepID=A0A6G7VAA0_9GAMM|nr:hypothetical protein [Caldichromatium japonicum]QIK36904.1 hypothetical protein GWK36_01575 [Caldichromatium japonicum]
MGPVWAQAEQGTLVEEQRQSHPGLIEHEQLPSPVLPEPSPPQTETPGELLTAPPATPETIPPERIYSPGRRAEPRLWEMLNQGQYQALDAEIKRLRVEDPNWTPPDELIHWLNHHLGLFAQPQQTPQAASPPVKRAPSPAERQRLAYEQAATDADRLHRRGQSEAALRRLAPWVERIYQTRDAERLELLAWIRLALGQSEQALADFRQALAWRPGIEAVRGELLALQSLGRDAELLVLAPERIKRWPNLKQTALDALRGLAAKRHESGDYETAQRLLATAVQLGADDLDTHRLAAWNLYNLGQFRLAADRFQTLYRATKDEDSAQGLILSLRALNAAPEIAAQAQTVRDL